MRFSDQTRGLAERPERLFIRPGNYRLQSKKIGKSLTHGNPYTVHGNPLPTCTATEIQESPSLRELFATTDNHFVREKTPS
jgi:hypothetical protein